MSRPTPCRQTGNRPTHNEALKPRGALTLWLAPALTGQGRVDRKARSPARQQVAALAAAPRCDADPRNPGGAVRIGGNSVIFGLVPGPPKVYDRTNGRRSGNMTDNHYHIRLAQYFNAIHMIGNEVSAPLEQPANTRKPDACRANQTLGGLTGHCAATGRGGATDGIRILAIARGITPDETACSAGVAAIISVSSPHLFDSETGFDAIASVPAGGRFLGAEHTAQHGRTPVRRPLQPDGSNLGAGAAAGEKTARDRATDVLQAAQADCAKPAMAPAIHAALDDHVARRKAGIGTDEP